MILYTHRKDETYIAYWHQTKWLVLSSFFFTIGASYAYSKHLYSYSILLFFTSFISANYWRKATYSWRRDMDLIVAKMSFVVFVSNGVYYVRTIEYMIPGYIGLLCLVYSYYLSAKFYRLKHNNWYKYHFMFHLIMAFEQMIILDSIDKTQHLK